MKKNEIEELDKTIERAGQKIRFLQNKKKAVESEMKYLTRAERTHRLCTRGAMLESYLGDPSKVTDEQVSRLLKDVFRLQDVMDIKDEVLGNVGMEGGDMADEVF